LKICYNVLKGGDDGLKKQQIIYTVLFFGILLTETIIALFANDNFVRPYVGDVLVTVLICCFFRVFISKSVKALPLYVLLFAVAVEIGQYFDIVKLIGLENNKFFSILLGRSFSAIDILCYALGCLLYFIIDHTICKNHDGLSSSKRKDNR